MLFAKIVGSVVYWTIFYIILKSLFDAYPKINLAVLTGRISPEKARDMRSRGGWIVIFLFTTIIVWSILVSL